MAEVRLYPVKPEEAFQRAVEDIAPGCKIQDDEVWKKLIRTLYDHTIVIMDGDLGDDEVDAISALLYGDQPLPEGFHLSKYPGDRDSWIDESLVTVYGGRSEISSDDPSSGQMPVLRLEKKFGTGPEQVNLTEQDGVDLLSAEICAPVVREGDTGFRPRTSVIHFANGNKSTPYKNPCIAEPEDSYVRIDVSEKDWLTKAIDKTQFQIKVRAGIEDYIQGLCK